MIIVKMIKIVDQAKHVRLVPITGDNASLTIPLLAKLIKIVDLASLVKSAPTIVANVSLTALIIANPIRIADLVNRAIQRIMARSNAS
jgi:hypothetical protein